MRPKAQGQVCTYGKRLHRDGIFPELGLQDCIVSKPSIKRNISSLNFLKSPNNKIVISSEF